MHRMHNSHWALLVYIHVILLPYKSLLFLLSSSVRHVYEHNKLS